MAETLRAVAPVWEQEPLAEARWYACYTRARHEKQVDRVLRERGFETYLPLIERTSQWKDRKKQVEWPLFPSYVFSRFCLGDVHRVLTTPGLATLVKVDGRPLPIPDADIENVRLFAQALSAGAVADAKPQPFLAEGEWVEVLDGPLKGVRGVVVEWRTRRRVLIGLPAIGQGMEVDIEAAALRPVATP